MIPRSKILAIDLPTLELLYNYYSFSFLFGRKRHWTLGKQNTKR